MFPLIFCIQASNPGQFDSDMESQHWMKGSLPDSVYHIGCVGINNDHPDEALTVHGNIKLSGQILHTSDIRAKQDLEEVRKYEFIKWHAITNISEHVFDAFFTNDTVDLHNIWCAEH